MSDLCETYGNKKYIEKPIEKHGVIVVDGKKYIRLDDYEKMKSLATSLLFPETPLEVAGHIIENVIHEELTMYDYDTDFLKEVVEHLQVFLNHRKPLGGTDKENDT